MKTEKLLEKIVAAMQMVGLCALLVHALCLEPAAIAEESKKSGVDELISRLADEELELRGIPFPEVVRAATGKRVIPFNLQEEADRELLGKISSVMDTVLKKVNAPDHPAQKQRRINEASAFFEKEIMTTLNTVPGFSCERPQTAGGKTQISGYPDLRLVDKTSGRVIYVDPKLYEQGHRDSSLRTFYFEPKKETNKILDDAHHLIVGIEHDGRKGRTWKFLNWELVDVSHFNVRLKAEFQGSNKDLYRPESIVGTSRK